MLNKLGFRCKLFRSRYTCFQMILYTKKTQEKEKKCTHEMYTVRYKRIPIPHILCGYLRFYEEDIGIPHVYDTPILCNLIRYWWFYGFIHIITYIGNKKCTHTIIRFELLWPHIYVYVYTCMYDNKLMFACVRLLIFMHYGAYFYLKNIICNLH